MKMQQVVVETNTINIEERLNQWVTEMNKKGWTLTHIISHGTTIFYWTLLFEKETKDD